MLSILYPEWKFVLSANLIGHECSKNMSVTLFGRKVGRKEMFYLTTHSTHFIYGYMESDIW